jgi:succinate dehydrogenase/fumarate reductase cytochrome b subunit
VPDASLTERPLPWPSAGRALRVAPPAAALAYPLIVWCGSRTSAVVLAASLAVPILGLIASYQLGRSGERRFARWVAHLTVAAPPLFSLLGGWLDFQHAIPVGSVGVWIPLWSALCLAVLVERTPDHPANRPPPARIEPPSDRVAPPPSRRPVEPAGRLAVAHGISATVIAVFAAAHVTNHLGGLLGGDTHVAIMRSLRTIYRHPLVEPVLLAALAFQVASGLWLLRRKLPRVASGIDTLQTTTGAYLLVFLLSHLSAVLRAHHRGVDTDWSWLAGGELLTDPWSARLVPYYFLAVIAFTVHAACGLRKVLVGHGMRAARGTALVAVAAGTATLVSALILTGLFRA